ncbi:hypothetical protein [Streptomyces sp. NPDC003077]|uniref:hypothetical protein n=1 Tax=Streptomyces sp. NPDC003077 TaxID=3154443 RepID=UPI0033A157F3
MRETDGRLPDRDSLRELLDAEKTRALHRILPPWIHFALGVLAAAGAWLPTESAARAVVVAAALAPGLHVLLRTRALMRALTVYDLPGDEERATGTDPSGQRLAARTIAVTTVVTSVALAVVVLLLPLTWLRVALPVLCLWFVVDLLRQRQRRLSALRVIEQAARQDWYPAYTRLVERRRATST